jgi:N utilization substance protein B
MGTRRKARECALQMLFAADVTGVSPERLSIEFWSELEDGDGDQATRDFADNLVRGTLEKAGEIDELIRSRAEHWRIPRMAVVDRNILRMAVYEFVHEATPRTVVINEALEIARRFSTYEATQFINGILDAVKHDLDSGDEGTEKPQKKKKGTSA